MSMAALPDLRAAQNPAGAAVADDCTALSNIQFLHAVQRAAAFLHARGVVAGDVVAIMLPNATAFVVSMFAAWRLGLRSHRSTRHCDRPRSAINSLTPTPRC